MTHAGLVLKRMRARPLRTTLTVFAFGLSVGLLGFLWLLNDGLQREWSPYMAQRAIVMAKTGFFEKVPMAYLNRIRAVPGVREVVPFDFLVAFKGNNRVENQIPLGSAPPETLLKVYTEMKLSDAERKAWLEDPTGCVVGPVTAEKFKWKVGDRLALQAPVPGGVVETTVRAIFDYRADAGVYIHRRYYEQLVHDEGTTQMFWVLANTRDDVPRITAAVEKDLENSPVPIQAMTERQWQLSFLSMLGNVKALLGGIGVATGFALLLVTANTLAMGARERRGEAALLRILGFSRGTVAGLVLMEAAVYGVAGAILGSGIMLLFAKGIGKALDNSQYAGMGAWLVPDVLSFVLALGLGLVLAAASGVVPALGLSRRSIVHLLREPG